MSKILIVDDEEAIRQLLRIMCTGEGHHVDLAESGLEAIELLKQCAYDVLITDLKMTLISGLELAKVVRSAYPQTKIIMITGWPTSDSETQAKKLGIHHYFRKPFNRAQIIGAINELLAAGR
jgi:CheY-like chemotaxis protein